MTVVVGVDGSPRTGAVVSAAVVAAGERDQPLRMVHVWSFPYPSPDPKPWDPYALAREEAQAVLDDAIAQAGVTGTTGILVESDHAGAALVDAAAGADLLVVGSHGHGLASHLRGSVAAHVERHATCPVLVVPA